MTYRHSTSDGSSGSILLAALVLVLLSMTAMSLLMHTGYHIRIQRALAVRYRSTCRVSGELNRRLHALRQHLTGLDFNDPQNSLSVIFSEDRFPDSSDKGIRTEHHFQTGVIPHTGYTRHHGSIAIRCRDIRTSRTMEAEVCGDILSGEIPLTLMACLLNPESNPEQAVPLNRISLRAGERVIVDRRRIRLNVSDFLINALNIRAETVTWNRLRQSLRLEGDGPLPAGPFLAETEDRIHAVFIQGHLDRLRFSCRGLWQVIHFTQGKRNFSFQYLPKASRCIDFNGSQERSLPFSERLIVNGDIESLEQMGEAAFARGATLTLLVSGSVSICSSLVSAASHASRWRQAPLTLLCARGPLTDLLPQTGTVRIRASGRKRLDTAIISSGKVIIRGGDIQLNGSIFARGIDTDSHLNIRHCAAPPGRRDILHTPPRTYLRRLLVMRIDREASDG